ncbi:MAG: hypothetical protein MUP52_02235 [Candidatus Aminicenantes bacterium]|nr:hypothetical protein [Candidatus Aminicenantes bacterium]
MTWPRGRQYISGVVERRDSTSGAAVHHAAGKANSHNMHILHPRPAEWNFVLVPLSEIAADLVPPILKRSFFDLLKCSPDRHAVVKG